MVLPTFLVIGAAKSGTTSLWEYLRRHPEVAASTPKELDFFSVHWERGPDWYVNHFAHGDKAKAVGEVCPSYAKAHLYPRTAERIGTMLPEVRLVYVLRDPIERMISEYRAEHVSGRDPRPIDRALRDSPKYLGTSRYGFQLEAHLQHTPRERILILFFEDLRDRPHPTVSRLLSFIGANPSLLPNEVGTAHNVTSQKRVRRSSAEWLRDRRWWGTVATSVPAPLRRLGARVLSRPVTVTEQRPSQGVRDHLADELRDDLRLLARHLEPEFGGWGLL